MSRTIPQSLGISKPHLHADLSRGWWCHMRKGPIGWGLTQEQAYFSWKKLYEVWKAKWQV